MTQTMVDTGVITRAVELACRAPSLHNSQPWRWVVRSTTVDLFADPHRIVTGADSSGREAIISCGAVLDHFRVAMAAIGCDSNIDIFPNPNNLDHLAAIDFTPMGNVAQARRDLAKAILQRRTDRRPFRAPEDWASFEPVLHTSYDNDLATLEVLPDEVRPRLAQASRLAESLRRYDDLYHHELHWWTEPSRESEGIPQGSLVSASDARRVDVKRPFPARWYREQSSVGPQDQAKILLLSTPGDTRRDAFNCGQALSAVLLECTVAGLATCPVTHVTELEATRDIIRDLTTDTAAVPQLLIRVGIEPAGEVPPLTPRRPMSDVLEIHR
ncbi:Acg family FMN-binding oxidoreductase [Mycobacterium haemophilum]|uniref:NAD(P)H nitroreductase n=1 Tax=Mycobacterium haemophilum TaxID=29311 RepID=A0A0I9URV6_9MYCO|nr:NAD(P)H nitroreductase [Mycobacterium haemophilum]AKN18842.1 NAD(P)H nitroreductase [Mycobacterium haemophilum DSM 44634]KLO33747.1 NAD(P)H nitroreductase [Mycobacterium haemophilum]KLO39271.1 NAD(P)H nitroreductase [Mycobacterium haemophilum]KLO45581.1 NAD(P)H nitroreductase [Mycobacterium haemophilum]KLO56729.1 NAD(P)H nitroreductase [Mycobacterium haemophilum]